MLLSGLKERTHEEIAVHLSEAWLTPDEPISSFDQQVDHVYFPKSGLVAVAMNGDGGRLSFVGLYGSEGAGPTAALFGAPTALSLDIVQFAGIAQCMPIRDFRQAMSDLPDFRERMLHYAHVFMMQISFTAFANGSARVEQRVARWLLMLQDRMGVSTLAITHQRLADLVGVRRSGVTDALHDLEGRHMIRARRGVIDIVDRDQLKKTTRGSYGVPEAEYRRLLL